MPGEGRSAPLLDGCRRQEQHGGTEIVDNGMGLRRVLPKKVYY